MTKISNSHCKLTYHCRNWAQNSMEYFCVLWPHRDWI